MVHSLNTIPTELLLHIGSFLTIYPDQLQPRRQRRRRRHGDGTISPLLHLANFCLVSRRFYTLFNPLLYRTVVDTCCHLVPSFGLLPLDPAIWAITNHRHSTLRLLLDHGLGNSSDGESFIKNYLLLSMRVGAARGDGDTSITALLLDHWKYPEILERYKQNFCSPLHHIIDVYGNVPDIEVQAAIEPWVRLLLERGWEVDSRNRYLQTPLMLAVHSWNAGLVRILLEAGADGGLKDLTGWTALDFATNSFRWVSVWEEGVDLLERYGQAVAGYEG
jgi:hypothetical protein